MTKKRLIPIQESAPTSAPCKKPKSNQELSVIVNVPSGGQFQMNVNATTSVKAILAALKKNIGKQGLEDGEHILLLNGRYMREDLSLAENGLQEGDRIDLVYNTCGC